MRVVRFVAQPVAACRERDDVIYQTILFRAPGALRLLSFHLPYRLSCFRAFDPAVIKHPIGLPFSNGENTDALRAGQTEFDGLVSVICYADDLSDDRLLCQVIGQAL